MTSQILVVDDLEANRDMLSRRLRQLGQQKLRELRALIPPPSERVFEHEARVFLRDLDVFLSLEAGTAGRVPVGFEVPFGTGEIGEEPLGRVEPIQIDLGGGLRFLLRGGIDRVDRLADGSYEIVDYKTGSASPFEKVLNEKEREFVKMSIRMPDFMGRGR